jgi:methylamine utilization protein MauE
MPALLLRTVLGAILVAAALLKLAAPARSRAALVTFGVRREPVQWAVWAAMVAAELGLAAGVVAGWEAAAWAAAGLQLGLAAVLARALGAGRAGAPCGCFGARSRVTPAGVARNLALAAALAAVPFVPGGDASAEAWLGLGLGVALAGVAALTVAVLALAREVGELRLALGPQAALDIAGEGPEIGGRTELIAGFQPGAEARLALAVFLSESCPVCASLGPAVALLERDPQVAVRSFDEEADAEAWEALAVPGAPYAVALSLDGEVLAKGTFNTLPQLESVLGAAERRTLEPARSRGLEPAGG